MTPRRPKHFVHTNNKDSAAECFYGTRPCQRRFQNRFRAFSPSFFYFLLVRPVHVDVIINTSLSRVFCSFWPHVALNVFYFLVYAIDGSGGGYRRNTLPLDVRALPSMCRLIAKKQLREYAAHNTAVGGASPSITFSLECLSSFIAGCVLAAT